MNNDLPHILTILGPTASGKTTIACSIAHELGGEIISADSRQVYRHMDIGTGKDLEEYIIEGHKIPYHLIDIKSPGYKYNIAEYQIDFLNSLRDVHSRAKVPILCGGSGMYIEAALKGNSFLGIPMNASRRSELEALGDSELNALYVELSEVVRASLRNKTRRQIIRAVAVDEYLKENPDFKTIEIPPFQCTLIGVSIDREIRRERITRRLNFRLNNGLIEEVQTLLDENLSSKDLNYYGLEYKWVGLYLDQQISKKELFEGLNKAIHKFSKRQMTWYRRMEKNGYQIHWIEAAMSHSEKVENIISIYQAQIPLKKH